jgi:hypothetical protein
VRTELKETTLTLEAVTDERNGYKAQVQQMNLALRNGLEHIKLLRGKVGLQQSSSPASFSPPPSSGAAVLPSTSMSRPDLGGLQTCLATLRAEMALLQSRLAPQSASPSPSPQRMTAFVDDCDTLRAPAPSNVPETKTFQSQEEPSST